MRILCGGQHRSTGCGWQRGALVFITGLNTRQELMGGHRTLAAIPLWDGESRAPASPKAASQQNKGPFWFLFFPSCRSSSGKSVVATRELVPVL